MPNRRVGRNKRAGGKILKKNKRADPNKAVQGQFFFSKLINVQGKYQYKCRKINVQGDFFLKINKRACMSIRHNRVNESPSK